LTGTGETEQVLLNDRLEGCLGVTRHARHGSSFFLPARFDAMRFTSASKSLSNWRS